MLCVQFGRGMIYIRHTLNERREPLDLVSSAKLGKRSTEPIPWTIPICFRYVIVSRRLSLLWAPGAIGVHPEGTTELRAEYIKGLKYPQVRSRNLTTWPHIVLTGYHAVETLTSRFVRVKESSWLWSFIPLALPQVTKQWKTNRVAVSHFDPQDRTLAFWTTRLVVKYQAQVSYNARRLTTYSCQHHQNKFKSEKDS